MTIYEKFNGWYRVNILPATNKEVFAIDPDSIPDYILYAFLYHTLDWTDSQEEEAIPIEELKVFVKDFHIPREMMKDCIGVAAIENNYWAPFESVWPQRIVEIYPDPPRIMDEKYLVGGQYVTPMYIDSFTASALDIWLDNTRIFETIHPTPLQLTELINIAYRLESDHRGDWTHTRPSSFITEYGKRSSVPVDIIIEILSNDAYDGYDFIIGAPLDLFQGAGLVGDDGDDALLAQVWDRITDVCAIENVLPETLFADVVMNSESNYDEHFIPMTTDIDMDKLYMELYTLCYEYHKVMMARITEKSHELMELACMGKRADDPVLCQLLAYLRVLTANGTKFNPPEWWDKSGGYRMV